MKCGRCPEVADSVAKVGEVDQRRNIPSRAGSFLNLPLCGAIANESILRVSVPKRLLQHYRHICDVPPCHLQVCLPVETGSGGMLP